ncbi:hypothetical protein BRD19_02040 [Halobacteriales archaeon SW_7_65_23]|nr:MAG: hypothetical protein BRD19_02040 [Halobacteriales archaeon SW_7_65_23]
MQPTTASDDHSVAVSVRPEERSVAPEATETFDVVVEGPTNGLSTVVVELSLSDAAVATVTDVELTKESMLSEVEIDDGVVTVEAALGTNTFDPADEIVPITFTVEARSSGSTEIRVEEAQFDDLDGEPYSVHQTTRATVRVDDEDENQDGDEEQGADEEQDGDEDGSGEDGGNEESASTDEEGNDEPAENGTDGDETDSDGEGNTDEASSDEEGRSAEGDGTDDGQDESAAVSDDDDGETTDDDGETADDDGPGFGLATGVASFGALGYGLLRRVSPTAHEEQ